MSSTGNNHGGEAQTAVEHVDPLFPDLSHLQAPRTIPERVSSTGNNRRSEAQAAVERVDPLFLDRASPGPDEPVPEGAAHPTASTPSASEQTPSTSSDHGSEAQAAAVKRREVSFFPELRRWRRASHRPDEPVPVAICGICRVDRLAIRELEQLAPETLPEKVRFPWSTRGYYEDPGEGLDDALVLRCGHMFGRKCFAEWFEAKKWGRPACPLCQTPVVDRRCGHWTVVADSVASISEVPLTDAEGHVVPGGRWCAFCIKERTKEPLERLKRALEDVAHAFLRDHPAHDELDLFWPDDQLEDVVASLGEFTVRTAPGVDKKTVKELVRARWMVEEITERTWNGSRWCDAPR